MYVRKTPSTAATTPTGMPTPTSTPPPPNEQQRESPITNTGSAVIPTFKADVEEGQSPKSLATDPLGTPDKEEALPERLTNVVSKQEEDAEEISTTREENIYAEKALQCRTVPCF